MSTLIDSGQYQTEWFLQADDAGWDGTKIIDNEGMGYNLVFGIKLSDTLDLEVGHGHSENELDMAFSTEDDLDSFYAQLSIKLAEGVNLTPEIGMIDWGNNYGNGTQTIDGGDSTYVGARWQIVF